MSATENKLLRQRVSSLTICLRRVLRAIERAEEVGCIDHLDCWDDADEDWHEVIEQAKEELNK